MVGNPAFYEGNQGSTLVCSNLHMPHSRWGLLLLEIKVDWDSTKNVSESSVKVTTDHGVAKDP